MLNKDALNKAVSQRRGLLARVHIAKKALGMDDASYREVLTTRYGVESAGELRVHQLIDLCNHFVRCGWRGPQDTKARREPGMGKHPRPSTFVTINEHPLAQQKRYILALWQALGYEPTAIHARVRRQFGVDDFRFLQDGNALQTLAKDLWNRCQKRGLDPDPMGA